VKGPDSEADDKPKDEKDDETADTLREEQRKCSQQYSNYKS
jgi:hypothetical protein